MTESERPIFWVIAGPNGSGKSTLYTDTALQAFDQSVWIINPDRLTLRIRNIEKLGQREANLQAVIRIEKWLEASIQAHQTVGVETVLSTDKYRRLISAAKAKDYEIRLIYVMLASPDLNVERVKLRVRKGGHNVPMAKVRERWTRSLEQLPWFLEHADWAAIYDNSGAANRLVGQKADGTTMIDAAAPSALLEALSLGSRRG